MPRGDVVLCFMLLQARHAAWWVHTATTGRGFTVRVARAPSIVAEMVRGWTGPLKSLAAQTGRHGFTPRLVKK